MRIGLVTVVYKPVINGVTHMVALYKQHLQDRGHEVTIFTLGGPDPEGDELGVIRSPAIPLGDYGYHFGMGYTREAQERLRLMDIVHCHHLIAGVDLAHRYASCPIVLTNHTRHDLYTGTYLSLPQPAADALMRQVWPEYTDMAEVVIAPTASVREVLLEFGVRQPIEVIPNGVELGAFHVPAEPWCKSDLGVPESAVLVVFVGRLSHEKNVDRLLQQFAIAADIVPALHLCLAGQGPAEAALKQMGHDLGLAERIHFTGRLAYEQIPNLLAAADFFATASVTEVHPLTVIEAMGAGLPVAGTRSPGMVDIVEPGVTGFLVELPEKGLAAAITALAASEELRRRMGRAALEASRRYDITATVASTVDLYTRLHQQRPDRQRKRPHGRWYRAERGLWPKLDRLARLLQPSVNTWSFPRRNADAGPGAGEKRS